MKDCAEILFIALLFLNVAFWSVVLFWRLITFISPSSYRNQSLPPAHLQSRESMIRRLYIRSQRDQSMRINQFQSSPSSSSALFGSTSLALDLPPSYEDALKCPSVNTISSSMLDKEKNGSDTSLLHLEGLNKHAKDENFIFDRFASAQCRRLISMANEQSHNLEQSDSLRTRSRSCGSSISIDIGNNGELPGTSRDGLITEFNQIDQSSKTYQRSLRRDSF